MTAENNLKFPGFKNIVDCVDAVVVRRLPVSAGGAMMNDASLYVDAVIELRQFLCPGCGTLLETEIAPESDPTLRDIELSTL